MKIKIVGYSPSKINLRIVIVTQPYYGKKSIKAVSDEGKIPFYSANDIMWEKVENFMRNYCGRVFENGIKRIML